MSDSTPESTRETLSEGVAEVRQKLREDISRLKGRRASFTLRRMIECPECAGNGRTPCSACQGTGKAKLVMGEQETECSACSGTGSFTCVECGGRRLVPNAGRKKVLLVLWLGGVAWALVLLRLYMMERDILPGLRASGGGQMLQTQQAQSHAAPTGAGEQRPTAQPGYRAPNGGMMQPGGGGGMMRPEGAGGMMQPQGGGVMQPGYGR